MSYWSYALINNRLGEIYFTRKDGENVIEGHSYLRPNEHLTKREAAAIQHHIQLNSYSYYHQKYTHFLSRLKYASTNRVKYPQAQARVRNLES